VSSGTVSYLNQKIVGRIEEWRNRPIECQYPYLYLDGIMLEMTLADEVRKNVSILVAISVSEKWNREVLGCRRNEKDKKGWREFLRYLKKRDVRGVGLLISDACTG
jgi:putative transposase